jgi:CDP-diacylglycerol--glycerol-3-phosphate 3-phosphatidyltransferase
MQLTLPTILTLFRIALLPVIVVVFYLPEYYAAAKSWSNLAAAGIFIAAAITDWLDGWIARRYNMSSAFGAFLDPVADKLMVAVALFLIVQQNPTPIMAVASAVIVGREISISALREWMAELGQRAKVGVAWIGKFKTAMQVIAIVVCLHQRDLPELRLYRIGEGLLIVAAVLTIWSGILYVRVAWPIMRDADSGKI